MPKSGFYGNGKRVGQSCTAAGQEQRHLLRKKIIPVGINGKLKQQKPGQHHQITQVKEDQSAGADGTDLASALIVPVDAWDWNGKGEPAWGVERGDTGWKLATTPYYGDKFQLYGAFETGSVPVAFDEVMLATEIADVVGPSPAKGTVILIK